MAGMVDGQDLLLKSVLEVLPQKGRQLMGCPGRLQPHSSILLQQQGRKTHTGLVTRQVSQPEIQLTLINK